jgi:hypothetical protein
MWRILWKLLVALARPLGDLTLKVLLCRDLSEPLPTISIAVAITIRQATEADLAASRKDIAARGLLPPKGFLITTYMINFI